MSRISALSGQQKQTLHDVANQVVEQIISTLQQPIQEGQLEQQIVNQFQVDPDMAALISDILKAYPQYSKLIIADQQNQAAEEPESAIITTTNTTTTEQTISTAEKCFNYKL